ITNTGKVSANANPAIVANGSATASSITNSGTIESVMSGASRAIRLNGSTFNLTITNNAGGIIQSPGDAINSNNNITTGSVSVINSGTIQSTGLGANNGQAIDFANITGSTATITITNNATGIISAADADAIRVGNNGIINNSGQIISNIGT